MSDLVRNPKTGFLRLRLILSVSLKSPNLSGHQVLGGLVLCPINNSNKFDR